MANRCTPGTGKTLTSCLGASWVGTGPQVSEGVRGLVRRCPGPALLLPELLTGACRRLPSLGCAPRTSTPRSVRDPQQSRLREAECGISPANRSEPRPSAGPIKGRPVTLTRSSVSRRVAVGTCCCDSRWTRDLDTQSPGAPGPAAPLTGPARHTTPSGKQAGRWRGNPRKERAGRSLPSLPTWEGAAPTGQVGTWTLRVEAGRGAGPRGAGPGVCGGALF